MQGVEVSVQAIQLPEHFCEVKLMIKNREIQCQLICRLEGRSDKLLGLQISGNTVKQRMLQKLCELLIG